MPYSEIFKDKMVEKMIGPGARSANSLAKDVGVHNSTLSRWLRQAMVDPMDKDSQRQRAQSPPKGQRSRWLPQEKIRLVREAAAVEEADFGAFLRHEGLHEAELERIREEVLQAAAKGFEAGRRKRGLSPEEKELRALRKELNRKDKALAEAAALLVLRGKVRAFLSAEEEGDTDWSNDK